MEAERVNKGLMGEFLGEAHEVRTLADISDFITKGSTPTTYGFEWQSDGIPFLRSECVGESGFTERGLAYIGEDAHHALQRSALKPGDILITITGNVGRVAVLPEQYPAANMNQHIARVRITDSGVDAKYVQFALSNHSKRRHFESIVTGLAYPQLSLKQIRETELIFPPLPEQRRVAEILTAVDDSISAGERVIEQAERVKKGLMEELLTGGLGSAAIERGEVPKGWSKTKLSDAYQIDWGDTSVTKKSYTRSGYLAFSATGSDGYLPYYDYDEEGIVVSAIGARCGRVFWANGRWSAIKNTMVVRRKGLSHDLRYFFYLTHSAGFWPISGGAQPFIGLKNARAQQLALPPSNEQQRIAAILSSVDDQINAERKHIEQQKRLKRGLMDDLLTGRVRTV